MSLTNTNTNSNINKPELAKVLFRSARRQDFKTMKYILHNLNNVPLTNVEKSNIVYETIVQGKNSMTNYLKEKNFKVIWKGGEILKELRANNLPFAQRLYWEGASLGKLGQELTYVINNLGTVDVRIIKWVLKNIIYINPSVYYIEKFLRYFSREITHMNKHDRNEYINILRQLVGMASSHLSDRRRIRWSHDRKEFQLLLNTLTTYKGSKHMKMKEWIHFFIKNGAKFSRDGGEITHMLDHRISGNLIKYVIKKGAKFENPGFEISQAIESECYTLDLIKYLHRNGAIWHGTEIEMACDHEQPDRYAIIKYLIEKKAPWSGDELRMVIENRLIDVLKLFLRHNIPKDPKALLYSVKVLNYDAMKILLEHGGFPWSHEGKEVNWLCRHLEKLNNNNAVNTINNNIINNFNNVETSKQLVKKMLRLCVIYKANVSFNGTCPEYLEMLNAMKKSVKTIERKQFQRIYNPHTTSPSPKRKKARKSFNNHP